MKRLEFGNNVDIASGREIEAYVPSDTLSARTLNRPLISKLEEDESEFAISEDVLQNFYSGYGNIILPGYLEEMDPSKIEIGTFFGIHKTVSLRLPLGTLLLKDKSGEKTNSYRVINRPNISLAERQLAEAYALDIYNFENNIKIDYSVDNGYTIKYKYLVYDSYKEGTIPNPEKAEEEKVKLSNVFDVIEWFNKYFNNYLVKKSNISLEETVNIYDLINENDKWSDSTDILIYYITDKADEKYKPVKKDDERSLIVNSGRFGAIKLEDKEAASKYKGNLVKDYMSEGIIPMYVVTVEVSKTNEVLTLGIKNKYFANYSGIVGVREVEDSELRNKDYDVKKKNAIRYIAEKEDAKDGVVSIKNLVVSTPFENDSDNFKNKFEALTNESSIYTKTSYKNYSKKHGIEIKDGNINSCVLCGYIRTKNVCYNENNEVVPKSFDLCYGDDGITEKSTKIVNSASNFYSCLSNNTMKVGYHCDITTFDNYEDAPNKNRDILSVTKCTSDNAIKECVKIVGNLCVDSTTNNNNGSVSIKSCCIDAYAINDICTCSNTNIIDCVKSEKTNSEYTIRYNTVSSVVEEARTYNNCSCISLCNDGTITECSSTCNIAQVGNGIKDNTCSCQTDSAIYNGAYCNGAVKAYSCLANDGTTTEFNSVANIVKVGCNTNCITTYSCQSTSAIYNCAYCNSYVKAYSCLTNDGTIEECSATSNTIKVGEGNNYTNRCQLSISACTNVVCEGAVKAYSCLVNDGTIEECSATSNTIKVGDISTNYTCSCQTDSAICNRTYCRGIVKAYSYLANDGTITECSSTCNITQVGNCSSTTNSTCSCQTDSAICNRTYCNGDVKAYSYLANDGTITECSSTCNITQVGNCSSTTNSTCSCQTDSAICNRTYCNGDVKAYSYLANDGTITECSSTCNITQVGNCSSTGTTNSTCSCQTDSAIYNGAYCRGTVKAYSCLTNDGTITECSSTCNITQVETRSSTGTTNSTCSCQTDSAIYNGAYCNGAVKAYSCLTNNGIITECSATRNTIEVGKHVSPGDYLSYICINPKDISIGLSRLTEYGYSSIDTSMHLGCDCVSLYSPSQIILRGSGTICMCSANCSACLYGCKGVEIKANASNSFIKLNSACVDSGSNIYATSFTATSARDKKKDIVPTIHKAIDEINNIEIVDFTFKEGDGSRKIGFIADDTDEIFSRDRKHFDINNTVGMLLKAVQELSQENKELRKLIESK